MWFNPHTEKYCIKINGRVFEMSKGGFQQYFYSNCKIKFKPSEMFLSQLLTDYRPDMDLFYKDDGLEHINSFTPAPLMDVESGAEMPIVIGKLFDNLFDDKVQMAQFLNWLAYIYQARVRTQTAWVFAGKQGTGKGILVDYIIKGIWKHNAICNLTDSHLESAFNPYVQDKLFVHFNEISADTKKSRVAVKNRLKTWISDETIFINSKGIKEVERSNFCNLIMNSNEHIPIDIESGDRRFNVVRTDNVLKDQSWFTIGGVTVSEIVKELPFFASYLAGIKVDKVLAHSVVQSELKTELIEAVKTAPELIADALLNRDFEFFLDAGLEDWLSEMDSFNTPNITTIEMAFDGDFFTNDILSILISCVFGRKTTMFSASRSIMNRYKVGSRKTLSNKRGWGIYSKEPKIGINGF